MSATGGGANNQNYQVIAQAVWDVTVKRFEVMGKIHADYGKWLIITISSMHLAAIYLVSQSDVPEIKYNPACYWPFIVGSGTIILTGFGVWVNWGLNAKVQSEWLNANMLVNPQAWPQNPSPVVKWSILGTLYVPIVIGLISFGCVFWGGMVTMSKLHKPMPQIQIVQAPPKPIVIAPPPKAAPPQPAPPAQVPAKAETKTNPVIGSGIAAKK